MLHEVGDEKSNGVGIIVSEKIGKDVVRKQRWQDRIIVTWMMVKKQHVCIIPVYGPQTGRVDTEKRVFREMMVGAHVMMCLAGDFSGHVGTAKTGDKLSGGGEQGIERV